MDLGQFSKEILAGSGILHAMYRTGGDHISPISNRPLLKENMVHYWEPNWRIGEVGRYKY